ncbi:hypothetical protein [Calothrix sp. PCC 7507]|uniref:hypothetical protein n=1 Tax=Calothrix sp. PCC 7507 TaxID=99598 RepID=UPI00029EF781|nr:hypothetical protein [Calothrix sp. PCC 7507]AFY34921.1 hypothetical protein Cal7507_4554 [Calothrix sp. PCC 7507]
MFIDELSPIFKEFTQYPVSFLGGLFSGVFRLSLTDDPVKSWLDKNLSNTTYNSSINEAHNGKASGPQQISIE